MSKGIRRYNENETNFSPCKDRTKKVKEARDEAKKEVDTYRKNKDEEFKKFESEVRFFSDIVNMDLSTPYLTIKILPQI